MAKNSQPAEIIVPPQAIEAEQAVLGAMLSSKGAVSRAMELVSPEMFYKEPHGKMFQAMTDLFNRGEPVDSVSLINVLKKKKQLDSVGGAYYVTGLSSAIPTAANIDHYARIVMEKWSLRRLIEISADVTRSAYEDYQSVDDVLDLAEQKIFSVAQHRLRGSFLQLSPVLQETFEHLDRIHQKPGSVTGVACGIPDLDALTSGFQQGELVVVAGRPGMGKTAFILTLARNAAVDFQAPVGVFSLEMSNTQLAMRLLCAEARVDSHLVRTGKLPKDQWKNLSLAVGVLADAPIYLDDSPSLTVTELRAKARRLKAEHDIQMVIVDYLQLMQGHAAAESRQQEISQISRSLKGLAKELGVPVIAVSQLSRAVEGRTDHRPQLSDLRESGAIEQDADVVIFLFRRWMYSREEEDRGKADIILAKQRNGPTDSLSVTFIDRYARFEAAAKYEQKEFEVSA